MKSSHPLGEVFGFPADNVSEKAERFRTDRLCPFNNRVPSCTKDKATNPLGVCSILHSDRRVITCPVRFTEDWLISADAADFFFENETHWTSLREVRLTDANGNSAGNIDYILVAYDQHGVVTDFGAVEVQAVYISGNVRNPFEEYMRDQPENRTMIWDAPSAYFPTPDYLSSSRKRLIPQLLYKGGILHSWRKKLAIVIQESFFETIPDFPETDPASAEVVWLLYDLDHIEDENRFALKLKNKVYSKFHEAMEVVARPQPGDVGAFIEVLQRKLNDDLGSSPDVSTLTDQPLQ